MKSFNHVEDYIEYIGGYKNFTNSILNKKNINLARYDVAIVDSFCEQILFRNLAFSQKQADLAVSLIKKYKKQLEKFGINVPDTLDQFRLPIRKVDQTKIVEIDHENNKFSIKFPYNQDLISKFRSLNKSSDNDVYARFNYQNKTWVLPLTEYSLTYIKAYCKDNEFAYSDEIQDLYASIIEIENQPYKIELVDTADGLQITNAHPSLLLYIKANVGDLDYVNLPKLIDLSTTLGYTVHEDLIKKSSLDLPDFVLQKTTTIKLKDFDIKQMMDYAEEFGRTPVYAYLSSYKTLSRYKHENLIHLDKSWPDSSVPVKLFISQSPVLIGIKKSTMLKTAEKIIIVEHENM
jgi:hypothetical protein